MEDASLDEFLGGSDAESDGSDATEDGRPDAGADANRAAPETERRSGSDEGDADDAEPDAPRVDPGTVDPAATTYAWTGDAPACATCGGAATERWRDGDELVCADCKEW